MKKMVSKFTNVTDTDWRIGFLGTFHPAEETFRQLASRGWVSFLVLPESAGFRNDKLLTLAEQYKVPWSYEIKELESHDINLLLAANYPKIVPTGYLKRWPCINTHWSALPKYRGFHSTAWALLNGDYLPAVTIHWMEQDFDTGDILAQEYVRVHPQTTIYQLHEELAKKQACAVLRVLNYYQKTKTWPGTMQDHLQATYVPKRRPDDGIIDWQCSTERLWNLVRVLQKPLYPGAFTYAGARKLIIWEARPAECPSYYATPGQVVRVLDTGAIWVKTGDTCLEVIEAQWADSKDPKQPAALLDRCSGVIFGTRPQLDIPRLTQEVEDLKIEIATLKGKISFSKSINQDNSDEHNL